MQALSANPKGEVQFGGRHQANMTLGSNGVNMNVSSGAYDGFVIQVDDNSKFQWGLSVGGIGNDTVGALLSERDGSIIAGGDFSYTVWFGNVPSLQPTWTYSFGNSNMTKMEMELRIT